MNGRYATMEDAGDRLVEVFFTAVEAYYTENPKATSYIPDRPFLRKFIDEYVEREKWEVRKEELVSKIAKQVADYEREDLTKHGDLVRNCNKKMKSYNR